jgi:proteinaceous RNase P
VRVTGHHRHAASLFFCSAIPNSKPPQQGPRPSPGSPGRTRIAPPPSSRATFLTTPGMDHPRPVSAASGAHDEPNPPNPSKKQKTGKKKAIPLVARLRSRIHQAAKHVNRHDDAFAAFEEAKVAGIKLSTDCLVTLLFLAAGGDQWETYVYDRKRRDEYLRTKRLERCDEILASLRESSASSGAPMTEMCYTALARKEAILGDGEAAFKHALSMTDSQQKKNRCFLPALAAFGVSGSAARALAAYEALMEAGLEPGEAEFCKIFEAISKDPGMHWSKVEEVLGHMAKETTELHPDTIAVLRALFDSRTDFKATTSFCTVRDDGYCERCDDVLRAVDLDEAEYSQFAEGIASLAKKHGKRADEFDGFVKWLNEHGPFGVVIDAANVAFYNQNFESGGFNFSQIEAVVERVGECHPDLKPLVVLHINRTRGPAASNAKARALLNSLTDQNRFYAAPMGSNDDWYWMYAAVVAGTNGILVSNDEMRDHLFNLLAPKYFKKWKQRHQTRYSFSGDPDTLVLENPPPFTRCPQVLRKENGATSWMFPISSGSNDRPIDRRNGGNAGPPAQGTLADVSAVMGADKEENWLCCRL